ncbi:Sugar kinase of the NBD/HSP70 family, may contain an N-terminal HTH domain [Mucilaginibacter lappiensis]|uniref:NBD/HSP70 family sugar kinase n=1 Tax=Mucilaginibacter lappiensis TaxID=354630 RepID=A0ABR6PMT6_9SPHI|nr:ROK family protein [Mucilaginibacter lappiensis]MBB6111078.1 putative NBD/HSP70 family sugar kinase [Mucilaginibacter lappiensis]SIR68771.1 Sugar kinase of the NBD/HSP70 family, may contain an N-terminal HTH domain [Mucilaginibacter lappiensis]
MEGRHKQIKSAQLKSDILKQLYFKKSLLYSELSAIYNKSIPVINKIINQLIKEGFVAEIGYAASSGGRRPLMYSVKPDAMYIMAIAMDQFSTRMLITDMHNKPITEVKMIALSLNDNPDALPQLIEHINNCIINSGIDKTRILGIGIGMPGFVSVSDGMNYSYLDTGGEKLTSYIKNAIGLPIYIDNDSSLIALAEQKFGAARSKDQAMVINLGWGIGLGMIVNGTIFRGSDGFAGEFSHIPLSEDGTLCLCGKQGCLEAEASMLVVTKRAIEGIKQGKLSSLKSFINEPLEVIAKAIFDAIDIGDQYVIDLLSDAGYKIGKALAILIHIMNPRAIILSGRGTKAAKIMLAPIQQALNKYCIPRLAAKTELLISSLGFDAELLGAAALVMEYLDDDILTIHFNQQPMDKTR